MDNVYEQVVDMIAKCNEGLDKDSINSDSTFEGMGVDSIHFVKILLGFEEIFDIEFEDEYMLSNTYRDVKGLVDYIESVLKNE